MVCHISSRGNRQHHVFLDDRDRASFMQALGTTLTRMEWRLLAYCLMGNHYHLLLELTDANLADGMQALNGTYARRFNDRYETTGHVFEKRYFADDVRGEAHLLSVVAYIARNPVRAGLCRSVFDWRWSSAAASVREAVPAPILSLPRLWELIGETDDSARESLRRLFDVVPKEGEEVREAVRRQLVLAHRFDGLTLRQLSDALQVNTRTLRKLME
jgi:putative transposase